MIHKLLYKISQEKQTRFKMRWTQESSLKSKEGGCIIVFRICHKCVYVICYWLSQKEDSQK